MFKCEKVIITQTKDELGNWLSETTMEWLPKSFHSYENACKYIAALAVEDGSTYGATVGQYSDDEWRTSILDGFRVIRLVIFKVIG